MKNIYSLFAGLLLLILSAFLPSKSLATVYASVTSGNWNAPATWGTVGFPVAGDIVTISAGNTVTVNVASACAKLTVNGTLTWTTVPILTLSTGLILNATGAITGTATGTINDGGFFTANGGTIGRNTMNVTGVSQFTGIVTYSSPTGTQSYNGVATFSNGSGIATTALATRTINFGASDTIIGSVTFSCPLAIPLVSIAGNLYVYSAATLGIASTTLTVNGTTFDNGTIVYNDANGGKSFGTVTIAATGKWDCSGYDMAFTMTGNLTNAGTFLPSLTTVGPNLYLFTTAGSTINGTITIPHLRVNSPGTLTNTGFLTITDSLYGNGQYIQGTGSTLDYSSGNNIVITTFNPSTVPNLVDYDYAGNQGIKGSGTGLMYSSLNCSNTGTKTLNNNIIIQNNLTIQNSAQLDANSASNYTIGIEGNWILNTSNATPFVYEKGLVEFAGTTGIEALSNTSGAGESFYSVYFQNTSPASTNLTTNGNINIFHALRFTFGNMDLMGHNINIIGGTTNTTDSLYGGTIFTSVAGSSFNVTDPNKTGIIYYWGTKLGNTTNGITINDTTGRIQFDNFTQYGTAYFTKTLNTDDVFGGGNYFHGPVIFTATVTASRWRFGNGPSAVPDTFWNATFNADADSGSNNNFIIGANSLGNAFYGTTHMTSVTPGGFYICRQNGTGNASCEFHGPVVASIGATGIMTFADAASGNVNTCTFDSSITLNSTATSTGYFHFADNNAFGTVILNTGAQFLTGSINGKTNTYLCNVTQYGNSKLQTINTAGSTGALYIGGTTALPSFKCVFNGPCHFTADTAGYFVGCTFKDTANITVNHPNANGYIISDSFMLASTCIVGDIRIENNYFGGTITLQHTSSFSSTSNGGNTFDGNAIVQNLGTGNVRMGDYGGNGDTYYGTITFINNGGGTITPAYGLPSYFNGNISTAGSTGTPIAFASTGGTMVVESVGTQTFSNGGSAIIPTIGNLTMNAVSPTAVLQFNFSTSISGTLTLNQGLINVNNNTLTLGISTGTPGTLAYTGGWIYGGTFSRWFKSTISAIPSVNQLFPMGTDTIQNVYQPLWFGTGPSTLTTGGTLSVNHTPTTQWNTPTAPAFSDATWGNSVTGISIAAWIVSVGNGLTLSSNNGQLRYGGYGFGVFTLTDLDACKATSAPNQYNPSTNVTVPLEVNRGGLIQANLIGTWYIGTRNLRTSPLPIDLLNFDAQATSQGSVNITWSTASQTNNKLFTVEKTQDGISFDSVTTIPGAGNSNQTLNYSVLDENPFQGTSYYRLEQTDFDGHSTYSSLVPVNIAAKSGLTILPNPAHAALAFNYTSPVSGSALVKIVDASGREVSNNTINMQQGINTYSFNIDGLAKGSYYLQLSYGSTLITNKFIAE